MTNQVSEFRAQAILFTAYMVLVGLMDNILRPLLMARGLATPMPVIIVGVIGGAIAYGIVGLFFGPIVLSVAWAVLAAWVQGGGDSVGGDKHWVGDGHVARVSPAMRGAARSSLR